VNPPLRTATYVAHLRADAERMAVAYGRGPTDAPVAACPGWDVTRLVEHMAFIHRWADFAVRNAAAAGTDDVAEPDSGTDLAEWLRSGAATLADDLLAVDPDAPTWHPFPVERAAWVWARRQAHETAMHRWDAETATTGTSTLDARLAADGITEYVELAVPRIAQREHVELPSATVRIECTDVDGADHVLGPSDRPAVATLRATAEQALLVLMGRTPRSSFEIAGDVDAADAWLSIPGW
jgi:uncharacterized protein (TIGR03083 family)